MVEGLIDPPSACNTGVAPRGFPDAAFTSFPVLFESTMYGVLEDPLVSAPATEIMTPPALRSYPQVLELYNPFANSSIGIHGASRVLSSGDGFNNVRTMPQDMGQHSGLPAPVARWDPNIHRSSASNAIGTSQGFAHMYTSTGLDPRILERMPRGTGHSNAPPINLSSGANRMHQRMSVDTLLLNSAMGNPAPPTYGQGLASRANLNNVSMMCLEMSQHSRLPPELPLSPLAGRPRRAFRSSGVSETAVGSSNSRSVEMVRLGRKSRTVPLPIPLFSSEDMPRGNFRDSGLSDTVVSDHDLGSVGISSEYPIDSPPVNTFSPSAEAFLRSSRSSSGFQVFANDNGSIDPRMTVMEFDPSLAITSSNQLNRSSIQTQSMIPSYESESFYIASTEEGESPISDFEECMQEMSGNWRVSFQKNIVRDSSTNEYSLRRAQPPATTL
jgi:hypothetical protein